MDHGQFDELTRTVLVDAGGRRALLRALAGSALGGVAARLGLAEQAVAKAKHHGHKQHGHKPAGQVQAAGKKHKSNHKNKTKNKGKGKDKPPGPCPNGLRRCKDGTCMADKPGVCCADEEFCPGGGCRARGGCCPGETPCGGGVCAKAGECCLLKPVCDGCEEATCVGGNWECQSTCLYEGSTCCNGQCMLACSNGCQISGNCGTCSSPPAGKTYCAAQDRCVSTSCPTGQEFDAESCQCKDHCPAGTSRVCPPVPVHSDWKDIFGDEYPLPGGCCGSRYWWEDPSGVIYCSSPGHHVPSVTYRCNG